MSEIQAFKMSVNRTGISASYKKKCIDFLAIMMMLLFTVGCATQHKYKKVKAVPCPCETIQKKR
jgi:hypothetical protein